MMYVCIYVCRIIIINEIKLQIEYCSNRQISFEHKKFLIQSFSLAALWDITKTYTFIICKYILYNVNAHKLCILTNLQFVHILCI